MKERFAYLKHALTSIPSDRENWSLIKKRSVVIATELPLKNSCLAWVLKPNFCLQGVSKSVVISCPLKVVVIFERPCRILPRKINTYLAQNPFKLLMLTSNPFSSFGELKYLPEGSSLKRVKTNPRFHENSLKQVQSCSIQMPCFETPCTHVY